MAADLWSLLLTPIFGAYVIKSNWKILGQEQQEKRSKTWLIALIIVYIAGILFLSGGVCSLIFLVALLTWFFLECKPQKKHLDDRKIDYQKRSWKSLVPKAEGILIGAWIVFEIFFMIIAAAFGGPTLDYSSQETFSHARKS